MPVDATADTAAIAAMQRAAAAGVAAPSAYWSDELANIDFVNVASFQEMTDAQVDAYASLSAAAGCPALYSLNRERSRHNTQLTGISQALSRACDLRTVDVLDTDYTQAMKKPSKALRRVQAGRIQ
ncbi:MAG: hypothetical protein HY824_05140 [Acidobacteria bacterium]|nr:hypothetical protein [Acidobacteriota bacterium]